MQENPKMARNSVKIGGAIGFWGEAHHAMAPILVRFARQGVMVLSLAGGMNPTACAAALRAEIERQGLGLRVAVVEGDDLKPVIEDVAKSTEMFTGAPYPDRDMVLSGIAYLGAGPMVTALEHGADIVITGRCADSAMALAAAMHFLGWRDDDFDLLAAGSLAGHLIECGPQSTGGNYTDWDSVPDPSRIGYPIAEVFGDGRIDITKPAGTGGVVSRETVGEQMLYEIGDPAAYALPDVVCDFTHVTLSQAAADRVEVREVRGRPPTGQLKVTTTHQIGYRAGQVLNFSGRSARDKARSYIDAVLERTRARLNEMGLADFDQVHVETFGGLSAQTDLEEIAVTAAVRHQDARAVGLFLKELIGHALGTPPGLHFFTGGGRPKPSPVVAAFSSLVDADLPKVTVTLEDDALPYVRRGTKTQAARPPQVTPPEPEPTAMTDIRLEEIAVARSGDKGDMANIGVMARSPAYLPWIWAALTPERIAGIFDGLVAGDITRFYLPGSDAMNILMDQALGGGGIASLRNDSQGKAFAQRLLSCSIAIPQDLLPNQEKGAP